ncbi:TetR/AcrR family transcriptional regulator C-terminal domain-containing protein [Wenjunlia vitaminophila]|uniref:TetR/AcrR family transcriptional regulator C-terminal domain-containing protein n=1 Tax=Wenjunlia vitaminophila TaxID=76728 RepID=UPI0003A76D7C|nr:TetR/AcrR family transcriptional regulator C-terminal domain-containing protein [Wenjunlia vitaminophila]
MARSRAGHPLASVWLAERAKPSRRAAPEGLDRERIVAAVTRLLDAEGLSGFSMRRLVAELGVSAMSVYWYVDTKDDLLEMALDAVSGEVRLPDPAAERPWQEDLRQLASELRSALVAHPWASRLIGEYLNVGPNSLAMTVTALRVLDKAGVHRSAAPGALSALYQFVYGYATVEGRWVERCQAAGVDQDAVLRDVFQALMAMPGLAEQVPILQERIEAPFEQTRERDFRIALDTVVAGLEVMAGRHRDGA